MRYEKIRLAEAARRLGLEVDEVEPLFVGHRVRVRGALRFGDDWLVDIAGLEAAARLAGLVPSSPVPGCTEPMAALREARA